MNQLDETTRRALCAGDQPPAGVEDRILAAILIPLGPGPGPDAAPLLGAASGSGGAWFAAKIVAVTLGLAAAGVTTLGLAAAGVRAVREPAGVDSVVSADVTEPTTRRAVEADTRAPEPEPAPSLSIEQPTPTPTESGETHEGGSTPSRARAAASPEPSIPASGTESASVEAELALMQRARAAAQPTTALALLEQHREQFGAGVFAAEREVLRFERLCALGRTADAEAAAREFLAGYPDDPLRSRVTATCD